MDFSFSLNIDGCMYTPDQLCDRSVMLSVAGCDEDMFNFFSEWLSDETEISAHTSGSTCEPKSIRLMKKSMVESAKRTNAFFGLKAGDRILLCLSTSYIAGKMMVVRAMVGNLNLCLERASSVPVVLGDYDLVSMVPMQVRMLMGKKDGEQTLSRIRYLLVGGSPLPKDVAEWLKTLPLDTYISYGMTETVSHVALSSLKSQCGAEMVYVALPDVSFSADSRDCLVIRAPYLSSIPLVTNDVVRLLSDTTFVWVGRWDNVINTGGVKVFPEMVERKMVGLIDSSFYITSEPSEVFGQQVVLKIEGEPFDVDALMKNLELRLSRFEMPKKIDFVRRFDRTLSGKIKRN